jgi:small subunit ribosomal protein S16
LAVRIRLTRVGATKRPAYRVIAIDRRRSRDGRALEILGYYDPLTDPATVKLDTDRINAWIGKGAQPSDTVAKLIRLAERPPDAAPPKPKRATRAAKPKATSKAAPTPAEPAAAATESPSPGPDAPDADAPEADAAAEAARQPEEPEAPAADAGEGEASTDDGETEKAEA